MLFERVLPGNLHCPFCGNEGERDLESPHSVSRGTEAMRKLSVGLIFGGCSSEHEISIRSAHSVAEAVDRSQFELILIGIDRAGRWHLHDESSFKSVDGD